MKTIRELTLAIRHLTRAIQVHGVTFQNLTLRLDAMATRVKRLENPPK